MTLSAEIKEAMEAIAFGLEAIAIRNNKLLVVRCIATRSKGATSSSWHYY